ncbi:MAG TPA: cobalamin-binding protein, partial [Bellilinea sp.]|nr:cobalamin-binding protein [Bellilinea sp.]
VSLAPSNTELLYAVGAGAQVTARDEFSNFPEEATKLPSVGGSMGNYSVEQIVALKPDLVLAAEINTPELVKSLEDAGVKVYYLKNPVNLEGLFTNLETVGTITGHSADADKLIASLKARIDAVKVKAATVTEKPRVFYELDATDPAKPWTPGPGSFVNELIGLAGAENVAANLDMAWAQMSLEALLVADPQIILLGDAAYGVLPESLKDRAGWENITAVKEGAIHAFNDDTVSRPTPRLVDGLEEMFKLFHPEVK